jgi:hypothetical protein
MQYCPLSKRGVFIIMKKFLFYFSMLISISFLSSQTFADGNDTEVDLSEFEVEQTSSVQEAESPAPINEDFEAYLFHFSQSPGRAVLLGNLNHEATSENTTDDVSRPHLKFSIWAYQENAQRKLKKSGWLTFDIDNGQYNETLDWSLYTRDTIIESDFFPTASHIKYGFRVLREMPDIIPHDANKEQFIRMERHNLVEFDLPLPIWRVGGDGQSVRFLFGPVANVSFGTRNNRALEPLKQRFPNDGLDHVHANHSLNYTVGANFLLLLGRSADRAWKLGAESQLTRERTTSTDKHRVEEEKFIFFLASPERNITDRATAQLITSFSKANRNISTFVGNDYLGTGDEQDFGEFEIPEFDFDQEKWDIAIIIRY